MLFRIFEKESSIAVIDTILVEESMKFSVANANTVESSWIFKSGAAAVAYRFLLAMNDFNSTISSIQCGVVVFGILVWRRDAYSIQI